MDQATINAILFMIFMASLTGLVLIGLWFYRNGPGSQKKKRIEQFVAAQAEDEVGQEPVHRSMHLSGRDIGKFRDWINRTLSSLSSEELQVKLSSAYWAITDTEYLLIRIFGTALAFLLGWLILGNALVGIFLAAIALMLPPILLDRAIAQRQRQFQNQLLDVLVLINGAVQAGYGLMQAFDLAVNEVPPPASIEFGRVLHEVRLGLSLERALTNLSERMESDDLQIVITAVIINAQVGGNLSTVLGTAIDTIRDRMHLLGEIRSLTSYARYVGSFLSLMPFLAGLVIFVINPGYFDTVTTSLVTQIIFLMALLGVFIGNVWIRQIVKIRV